MKNLQNLELHVALVECANKIIFEDVDEKALSKLKSAVAAMMEPVEEEIVKEKK